ncbi:MAG: hypothetical protein K2X49_29010, partial [Acetobacteraceae bacterium]|nr:hypothetical protein [Acetobacteraceae bacterium]
MRPPPPRLRCNRLAIGLLGLLLAAPAAAQVDSREAIALQNQILQLRQEVEQLRRGGVAAPVPSGGRGGPSSEVATALLERVGRLEEEVRRMRGRLDELDFANRQQAQALEKLQGDMDFRLQQLEGGGGGAARPPVGRPAAPPPTPSAPPPPSLPPIAGPAPVQGAPPTGAPRTPERAIADGQAA